MTSDHASSRPHIAQLNIARMRAPLDDPTMVGFTGRLDEINALADRSPGFVWRLQTEDGDATALRIFDDPDLIINLSVWESVLALREFVYSSTHRELILGRRDWFEALDGPHLALWPVPQGHIPTIEEARQKLDKLRETGPDTTVFSFASVPPDLTALD